jgi:RNA polymerase sigma-70 factor (ECF subfamily)
MHADQTTVRIGAAAELRGPEVVARFAGRARGAQPALVDGEAAVAWVQRGELRVLFMFRIGADAVTGADIITTIELIADPDRLAQLDILLPDAS